MKTLFFYIIPGDKVFYCNRLIHRPSVVSFGGEVWRENVGIPYVQKHFLCSSLRYVCT